MNQDNLWNIPSSIARNERADNRRFAVGPNRSVDGREFVSNGVQTTSQCMQMRKPQCLHKWIVQAIRRLTNFYSDTSFFGNSRVTIVVKDDRYWSVINQFHRLEKPISKSRKVISSQTESRPKRPSSSFPIAALLYSSINQNYRHFSTEIFYWQQCC